MAFKIPSKRRRNHPNSTPIIDPRRRRAPKNAVPAPDNVQESSTMEVPLSTSSATPDIEHARDREVEGQEQVENELVDQIVMAVDMRDKETMGCCYYLAARETIFLMADIKSAGLDIVELLKLRIEPTVILLSTRVDERVDALLNPVIGFRTPYIVEIRPSAEFSYEAGKNKLAQIQISSDKDEASFVTPGSAINYDDYADRHEAGYTDHQGKLLRLAGRIDLESCLSVSCACAVISYLARKKAVEYLPADSSGDSAFRISMIESFNLRDAMFVNANTLSSLQILQTESHPYLHNQGPTAASSSSKEGLSVYGLFHHLARTPQGKKLLRQYFLRPSTDHATIKDRLDTASVFLRPDNHDPLTDITKSLGQIKNMRVVMSSLSKGTSGGIKNGIWATLRSFAFHAMQIREAMTEVVGAEQLAIKAKVLENFTNRQLANIGANISHIVDFPSSAEMHRTVVNPGVDAELDDMKRTYDGIEDLLNQSSQAIASSVPAQYSLDLNVIFFPQIGFLISMPVNGVTGRANYEGGDTADQQWDRIFSTATRVYYKDFRMKELDDTLGDMYAIICDKEIEIVHELSQSVLKHEEMLKHASDICGEIDCLLALAQGAKDYKLSRPRLTSQNVICIKGGRHPLQELTVPSYVANDTLLEGAHDGHVAASRDFEYDSSELYVSRVTPASDALVHPSTLILTGPNYSGKSIYLKQVAIIVYMAHVGCFVPADAATIGLTDKILTRIGTRETVSRTQSAFMIDLQQVTLAMTLATRRSLVIIDEFGKGTDSNGRIRECRERCFQF
ncbi:MAG: hypothetical protein Q9191_000216 [Dirinaria sp. TL-2023a]